MSGPTPELLAATRAHYEAMTKVHRWATWDQLSEEMKAEKIEAMRAGLRALEPGDETARRASSQQALAAKAIFRAMIDHITGGRDG